MTVAQLKTELELQALAGGAGDERAVTGCYVGDLLSWVMGRANADSVWITVMGNINAIAVAKLADISCILLCENAHLDDDARAQSEANAIPVLASDRSAYELAVAVSRFLEPSDAAAV